MKKTQFTEEQILFALKQGSAGQPVADVCMPIVISEAQQRAAAANARACYCEAEFGYERLDILLTREGWQVGRNRVHRLYKLEGLQVRMRVRWRKRTSLHRGPAPTPRGGGQYWAMDFVHDELANGRKLRVLTVIDKWHQQCVALQADSRLTSESVVDAMNTIALERSLPHAITVDH